MKLDFRWYDVLFVFLFLYLFVAQLQAIWPFTVDDMYISLRYAKHWAAGEGLLWNIHEWPVEGYSNFIFVVLGAGAIFLKLNPVTTLKVAGIVGLFVTNIFLYLMSRFWFGPRAAVIPCIWLLLYKGQIIWAATGMETTVYEAFICGSVFFIFRGLGYQFDSNHPDSFKKIDFLLAGLLLSLAAMTRPEAPVFIALFLLLICWDMPRVNYSSIFYFCLPLLVIFAPYFIGRWYYYGHLFPNPVYCKGFSKDLSLNLDLNYLKLIIPFLVLALPACLKATDRRPFFLWLPSFIYLLLLIGSDPVVAFDNRLFLPALVLLLPLSLQGLELGIRAFWKQRDSIFNLFFYTAAFFVAFFFIPKMSLADYHYFTQSPQEGGQLRSQVVAWLRAHTQPDDTVVLADSGFIPFYSELNFMDSYCLNNIKMTEYPKEKMYKQFCKDALQQHPNIIILTSLVEQGRVQYTPSDRCFKALLPSNPNYQLSRVFSTGPSNSIYRYELFSRKNG